MAPAMAAVTLERVAACAVLAGCRPEYFPVVVAAVEAVLEPAFNVGGQAVTTQPVGQVVVVNGPVRDAIGLNGSVGALGPGWRANMTIGRALRLVVSLTGGGFPGRLDRSTLGQSRQGRAVLRRGRGGQPVGAAPRRARLSGRAFGRDGVRGGRAAVDLRPPQHLARGARARAGRGGRRHLEPELVAARRDLAVRDLPRARPLVRRVGLEQAARARGDVRGRPPTGGCVALGRDDAAGAAAPDDQLVRKWSSPEDIVIVVAGGEAGRYSAVFGPCLGMNAEPISKEVPWTT